MTIVVGHDRAVLNELYRKAGLIPSSDIAGKIPTSQLDGTISGSQLSDSYALQSQLPATSLIPATGGLTLTGVEQLIPGLDFTIETLAGDVVTLILSASAKANVTGCQVIIAMSIDGVVDANTCQWISWESGISINPMSMVWRLTPNAGVHPIQFVALKIGNSCEILQTGTRVMTMITKG